ncbi:CobW family GTP-binding protein [Pigmentiphaga litoralis]|uniref:G3E family GTPase n=1 Tax=Pigmentiphaga litoralis TaxID=516702 RepID=A0A7Y9LII4_9BURK|nr:GTP-binding protein [Pigmentiphaga litoralis]NYE25419.1 G3E family GTPase [Pigmentiphaga litoralis]NYE80969.1 G3E family GTPase [Pigmentiphaga litoralis]
MTIARIPVYLVTGFLGSGKTTLLCRWLRSAALKDAAVIVNEIGEVGYDDQIIAAASDTPSLIANACVCCTGLPGLEEALESLFWARLQRRMPAFPSVVIETTGLADPGPVIAAFEQVALLRERYRLAGVITTLSVTAAETVLARHAEARSQIAHADVLVITKTDLASTADADALGARLQGLNAAATQMQSAAGDLEWTSVEGALTRVSDGPIPSDSGTTSSRDGLSTFKIDHDQDLNAPNFDQDQFRSDENIERDAVAGVRDPGHGDAHGRDHAHEHERTSAQGHSADADAEIHAHSHSHAHDAITTFVVMSEPLAHDDLIGRLQALADDFGHSLLRVKGWVQLDDGVDASVQLSVGKDGLEVQVQKQAVSTISGRRYGLTVICRGSAARAGLILSMPA